MPTFNKRLAQFIVCGAIIAAMILAVRHGLEKGADHYATTAFVLALGLVAVCEYLSWHNAACSWFERRLGGVVLWGALGSILTAGVVWTNFSSASSNADGRAGIQKAALEIQTDVGQAIKEKTAQAKRLEARVLMMPKRTPEGARQDADNAKAHRYWQVTEQCTKTLGPKTREFCDAYRSAVADESLGTSILVDQASLERVNAELKALRDQRAHQGAAVMGEDMPALRYVSDKVGVSLDEARLLDSVILTWMIQAMVLFGGLALAAENYRDRPRLPWIKWAKIGHGISTLASVVRGTYRAPTPATGPDMQAPHPDMQPAAWPMQRAPGSGLQVIQQRFDDREFAAGISRILEPFAPAGQATAYKAAA